MTSKCPHPHSRPQPRSSSSNAPPHPTRRTSTSSIAGTSSPSLSSSSSHNEDEDEDEDDENDNDTTTDDTISSTNEKKRLRRGTVYDAVAGRLTTSGFFTAPSSTHPSSLHRDTLSHSRIPLRPGEALFRHPRAPDRFEEHDVYDASLRFPVLPEKLPSSDLLVALHAYASDFFAAAQAGGGGGKEKRKLKRKGKNGKVDWRSLDESALLALGVLVEEAVVKELGGEGDLVFVEGEREERREERGEEEMEGQGRQETNGRVGNNNRRPVTRSVGTSQGGGKLRQDMKEGEGGKRRG